MSRIGVVLLLALRATLALRVVPPARASVSMGPFDGLKNPFRDKQAGGTTIAVTAAFQSSDRGAQSVLGALDSIAAEADTSTVEGISELCRDSALLLLRRSSQWLACSTTAQYSGDDDDALYTFDKLATREAAKFDDRDSGTTVDAALVAAGLQGKKSAADPTVVVVCALACLPGDRTDELSEATQGDAKAAQSALEELGAGGNDEVLAFELFWVPGDDETSLDMDELATDWPELIMC